MSAMMMSPFRCFRRVDIAVAIAVYAGKCLLEISSLCPFHFWMSGKFLERHLAVAIAIEPLDEAIFAFRRRGINTSEA